jgi:methionine synthase II (cobalamin-independent)
MTVQQNTDRIQTTHIGSLPRPHRLLDVMKAKYSGQPYDEAAFAAALRAAVAEVVREQVDCGIDIVTDGEFSKPGFFTYVRERLASKRAQASSSSCSSGRSRLFRSITSNISSRRCWAERSCRWRRWSASGRSSTAAKSFCKPTSKI